MNNKMRFVASDMDGTLLDSDGVLNQEFFSVFWQLKQNNIMFAAASGRQYDSLKQIFEPVDQEIFYIAENGALVMYQGKELYSSQMDANLIRDIIEETRKIEGSHIVACGKRGAYVETDEPLVIAEVKKYYSNYFIIHDLFEVDDEIIKLAICHFGGSEEYLYPKVMNKFGTHAQVVISSKIWLDIMNLGVSKGSAIKKLQELLSFNHFQTMCFGDYFNDVEMLKSAYYSYAVENAHEDVKPYARFIAPANSDNGVLSVIKSYMSKV
jgi:Cof subfamily protein (haloacid dehalogenase superfamily)